MSTSLDDRLVTLLSRWLARHVTDGQLREGVATADPAQLAPDQAEAFAELQHGLRNGIDRGDLEMLVLETLEALALGG